MRIHWAQVAVGLAVPQHSSRIAAWHTKLRTTFYTAPDLPTLISHSPGLGLHVMKAEKGLHLLASICCEAKCYTS